MTPIPLRMRIGAALTIVIAGFGILMLATGDTLLGIAQLLIALGVSASVVTNYRRMQRST